MVRPDTAKWGQTIDELRQLSVEAEHARTRERFQALYMIGSRRSNAMRWAQRLVGPMMRFWSGCTPITPLGQKP